MQPATLEGVLAKENLDFGHARQAVNLFVASSSRRPQHCCHNEMNTQPGKRKKGRPSRKDLAIKLGLVQREAKELGIPAVVIIEGLDGSGKGLLLNKLILELDVRAYDIYSIVPGTVASLSSVWKPFARTPSGNGPSARSTKWRSTSRISAPL